MGKVQFNYRIDSNVVGEWRKLVVLNEGGYAYRFLCTRLERILKTDILALRTSTQRTSSKQKITKQEVIEVKDKIIEWMLTPGSNPNKAGTALYVGEGDPRFIVERHLKEAIGIVTGKVDKRTVGNWIRRLEVFECIKWFGPHTFEFLTEGIEQVKKEEIQKENKQPTPIPKQNNIDAEKEANEVFSRFI